MESVRSQLLSLWSELNPADPLHDARGKRRDLDAEGVVDTVLHSYREWRPPEKHSEPLEIFAPSLHQRVQVRRRQGDQGELDVALGTANRAGRCRAFGCDGLPKIELIGTGTRRVANWDQGRTASRPHAVRVNCRRFQGRNSGAVRSQGGFTVTSLVPARAVDSPSFFV